MRNKSEALKCFKRFQKYVENHVARKRKRVNITEDQSISPKIKSVSIGNGEECISEILKFYLDDHGIQHQQSQPNSPNQYEWVNHINNTLINQMRTMLNRNSLGAEFWSDALSAAVYVRNRVRSRGLPRSITPHHLWHNTPPKIRHMRIFGQKCWYVPHQETFRNLNASSNKAIIIGYASGRRGYKLWDSELQNVIVTRSVRLDNKAKNNSVQHHVTSADNISARNDGQIKSGDSVSSSDNGGNTRIRPHVSARFSKTDYSVPNFVRPMRTNIKRPSYQPQHCRSSRVCAPRHEPYTASIHPIRTPEICNIAVHSAQRSTAVPRTQNGVVSLQRTNTCKPTKDTNVPAQASRHSRARKDLLINYCPIINSRLHITLYSGEVSGKNLLIKLHFYGLLMESRSLKYFTWIKGELPYRSKKTVLAKSKVYFALKRGYNFIMAEGEANRSLIKQCTHIIHHHQYTYQSHICRIFLHVHRQNSYRLVTNTSTPISNIQSIYNSAAISDYAA